MTPTKNGWSNNILMCGNKLGKLWRQDNSFSDAEAQSDNLYNTSIAPIWNGTRVKFFDTHTDFDTSSNGDYVLNATNLQDQLGCGYTFVDMTTHGEYNRWKLESGKYYSNDATSIQNVKTSMVVTMACLTNAFDSAYENGGNPCLSEAFIRNPNNSVISYLGCSRFGWFYSNGSNELGTSLLYNAQFYKYLFNTSYACCSYGAIVKAAKLAKLSSCNYYGSHRWVQFGLNPIGDPEMPVFINTPIEFDNISYTLSQNGISVSTGVDNCRICVMSSEDVGATYYRVEDNVDSAAFANLPENYSVCITKQGYIPYILEYRSYIQNETINGSTIIIGNNIRVGSSVTTAKPTGDVFFDGGTIDITGNSVIFEPGTTENSGTTLNVNN